MHAVGRDAFAVETVIQGAGVDDVGDFAVAVTFPGGSRLVAGLVVSNQRSSAISGYWNERPSRRPTYHALMAPVT